MPPQKIDHRLAPDIKQDTRRIEKRHQQAKKSRAKKAQTEEDELSQRWLAPALLIVISLISYFLYWVYQLH